MVPSHSACSVLSPERRWSEKVTYWQAESLRTEEIKTTCARQEIALKARESALAIEADALKAREIACVQREVCRHVAKHMRHQDMHMFSPPPLFHIPWYTR